MLGICARHSALVLLATLQQQSPTVTVDSLLVERADAHRLAVRPEAGLRSRMFSSFDRRSARRDRDWFADRDQENFLRTELHGARAEAVLADDVGPGAIVRIFVAHPKGRLRIYLDGAAEPAIDEPMASFLSGPGFSAAEPGKAPDAASSAALEAASFREPIPFARRAVVTCDEPRDLEYEVEVRELPRGTDVKTFERGDFARCAATRLEANASAALAKTARVRRAFEGVISPSNAGAPVTELELALGHEVGAGGQSISELAIQIEPISGAANDANLLEQALRHLVLSIEFDGERTVDAPLGDFFASPAGRSPSESARTSVDAKVCRLVSRFPMPYRDSARIRIRQTSSERVLVNCSAELEAANFGDASLYFHAHWTAASALATDPPSDWRELSVDGAGWFVGEVLSGGSPLRARWTRGDLKLWVDNEGFPSHFGTSTDADFDRAFDSASPTFDRWSGEVRRDARDGSGYTSFFRWRALDAIPFAKKLEVDREILDARPTTLALAATTFFYATRGAKTDGVAPDALAALGLAALKVANFKVDGALEAEALAVHAKSDGLTTAVEARDGATWSDAHELVGRANAAAQFVELELPVAAAGSFELIAYLSRGDDRGSLAFGVDGAKLAATFDGRAAAASEPVAVSLGVVKLAPPHAILRIETIAPTDAASPAHFAFGLDCVVLRAPGS